MDVSFQHEDSHVEFPQCPQSLPKVRLKEIAKPSSAPNGPVDNVCSNCQAQLPLLG